MKRTTWITTLAVAAAVSIGAVAAAQKSKKEPTREENLSREVEKLGAEMKEIRSFAGRQPAVLQEASTCLDLAETLAREVPSRLAKGDIHVAERLKDTAEDLLDAGRHLANARLRLHWDDGKARAPADDDNDSRSAARELEKAYFRTAQLEFFGRQAGADRMSAVAGLSRRLYQEGRAAFDRQDHFLARELAEASRSLSSAVEEYIQSLLPADLPPPPKVPKR